MAIAASWIMLGNLSPLFSEIQVFFSLRVVKILQCDDNCQPTYLPARPSFLLVACVPARRNLRCNDGGYISMESQ
jgi:hypothetical protein